MFKTKKKTTPQKIINCCQELNLFRYLQILQTKDLGNLIISGPRPEEAVLVEAMIKINEELISLRGDNNQKLRFDKITYMEDLKLKVYFCHSIVERIQMRVDVQALNKERLEKYISQLKSFGFRLNRDKPLIEELLIVVQELKGYQSTIDALHAEIYPDQKDEENESTKIVSEFYAMLLSYQRILKIDKINIKKTNLIEFVALEKAVQEMIASKPETN